MGTNRDMEEFTHESDRDKPVKDMVPVERIELSLGCPNRILKPHLGIFNYSCNSAFPLQNGAGTGLQVSLPLLLSVVGNGWKLRRWLQFSYSKH